MKRRNIIGAVTLAICSLALPAQAQDLKDKTIVIVLPAPAGSAPDVIARIVTESMRTTLGAKIVIENKPGAGGIIAVNAVKGAANDGTRLLFAQGSAVVVTPQTYKAARFEIDRDFETVAAVAQTPMMLTTGISTGPASLAAALAEAKAKPDTLSMGNLGLNSFPHLTGEMINQSAGVNIRQIPMGNVAQGIQGIDSGDITIFTDGVATTLPMVTAKRLRALAVTSAKVLPGLEGIPLAKDTVPGLVVTGWFVLFAPKGTPATLINQLNSAINVALQRPEVVDKLGALGSYPMGGSVADAHAFVKAEKVKWAGVIQKAGIQAQ